MDWLTTAEELGVGRSKRIDCECGTGKSAIVSNTDMDYHIHCFRCGLHQNSRKKNLTIRKIIGDEIPCVELRLPEDLENNLPERAELYLWEKGIYPSLAKKYKIGWSEKLQRLVIPVWRRDELVAVMARDVTGAMKRKVLNSVNRKDGLFYSKNAECARKIVLVEDAFSCMKVGEVADCWALNGTALTAEVRSKLCRAKEVTIWLDPDEPGRRAAIKIKKRLGSLVHVRIIQSERDPKYYTVEEIKEILK